MKAVEEMSHAELAAEVERLRSQLASHPPSAPLDIRRAQFFDRLLAVAPIFFWAGSSDYANGHLSSSAAVDITGYDADAFARRPELWFDIVHPEDQEHARHTSRRVFETGEPAEYECRIIHKDGSVRWVLDVLFPLAGDDGRVNDLYGYVIDISTQKATQAELERQVTEAQLLRREMHHRVKNNLQLVASLMALQEAPAEIGRLRSRVLAVARVHSLLQRGDAGSRVVLAKYLRELLESFARDEAGGKQPELHVSLESGAELSLDTAIPCALICNELVSNALGHAFPDRDGSVWVELRGEGSALVLSVRDDGIGGVDEDRPEAMGLAFVRGLAEQIAGRVDIDSGPKGTAITLTFPFS